MTRRRFYALPAQIADSTVQLSADETHHLVRVLRLLPGDEVFVFDGCGREFRCIFKSLKDNSAQLAIVDALADAVESPARVTLAQALVKGEKFDLVIQKATELGVSAIQPVITDYCEVRLNDEQAVKRLERWRRISIEALKQCGRRALVEISAPLGVKQLLATSAGRLLVFSESGGRPLAAALGGLKREEPVTALIGPEGGWSDTEFELFTTYGAQAVTLGPRVLRTQTAALVALSLIQHALGDLSR